jgi:peroxiredoxin
VAADVRQKAPDFTLPSDSWDNKVSLKETRREELVVLFFYPGDWSSVCTDQMGHLQQEIERLEEKGARVLAVSADSHWSCRARTVEGGSDFPLLSDFQREVVEKDGVKHGAGFPERAYFVVRQRGRRTG